MKRYDFNSFEEFENSNVEPYETVTVIKENGWVKTDVMTECKSWKTALRRFFKVIGNENALDGWYESLKEMAENGYFKCTEQNEWAWEIQEVDDNVWYIFLNVKEIA